MLRRVSGAVALIHRYSTTSLRLGRRRSRILSDEVLPARKVRMRKHYAKEPLESAPQALLTTSRQELQARLEDALRLREKREELSDDVYPTDPDYDALKKALPKVDSEVAAAAKSLHLSRRITQPKFVTFMVQGKKYTLDPIFLRDACPCNLCRDASSKQKNFETVQIPENIEVAIISPQVDGFNVAWNNDIAGFDAHHQSFYSHRWIRQQASLTNRMYEAQSLHRRRLWDLQIYEQENARHPKIDFGAFMADEERVKEALETVDRYGLVFLMNVPTTCNSIKEISGRIGPSRRTFYGSEWDVRSVAEAKNVAYTSKFLDLHMDLLYMSKPPGMQILHCMQPCSNGGESLFSDAFHAYECLKETDRELAFAFANFPVTYGYKNDGQWYQHTHPSVEWQPTKMAEVLPDPRETEFDEAGSTYNAINWSPPFQATFDRVIGDHANYYGREPRFRSYYAGAKLFKSYVQDEKAMLRCTMQQGECAIFDNRRILHGRTEFQGERWFRGTYIDTEVWRSRLRVLREAQKLTRPEEKYTPRTPRLAPLREDSYDDDFAQRSMAMRDRRSEEEPVEQGYSSVLEPGYRDDADQMSSAKRPIRGIDNETTDADGDQTRQGLKKTLARNIIRRNFFRAVDSTDRLKTEIVRTSKPNEPLGMTKKQRIRERKEAKKMMRIANEPPKMKKKQRIRERKEAKEMKRMASEPLQMTKEQRVRERQAAKKTKREALKLERKEMAQKEVEYRQKREQLIQALQVADVTRWRAEERASHPDPALWDAHSEEEKLRRTRVRGHNEIVQRKALQAELRRKDPAAKEEPRMDEDAKVVLDAEANSILNKEAKAQVSKMDRAKAKEKVKAQEAKQRLIEEARPKAKVAKDSKAPFHHAKNPGPRSERSETRREQWDQFVGSVMNMGLGSGSVSKQAAQRSIAKAEEAAKAKTASESPVKTRDERHAKISANKQKQREMISGEVDQLWLRTQVPQKKRMPWEGRGHQKSPGFRKGKSQR